MQVRLPALSRRRSLTVVAGEEVVPTVWASCLVFWSEHIPQRTASVSSQTATESREDLQGLRILRQQRPALAGLLQAVEQRTRPFAPFALPEHCPKHWVAKCGARPSSQGARVPLPCRRSGAPAVPAHFLLLLLEPEIV